MGGYTNWAFDSSKVCEVCWSEPLQGLETHCDRYRNSPVMHELVPDEFRPVLFDQGVRIPFPAPTKRIRPPRTKTHAPFKGKSKLSYHPEPKASSREIGSCSDGKSSD